VQLTRIMFPFILLVSLAALVMGMLNAKNVFGMPYRPDFQWRDPGVAAVLGLMGPSVIAASTTQVNVLINSMFASRSATARFSGWRSHSG
jgi:peptidoglycan biosynthesis protein MviN/MurJ (putative lipid II flippase)